MKKAISLLLALVLCLSLCACGGNNEELEKYQKYETLINYLEAEDFKNAYSELLKISQGSQSGDNKEEQEEPELVTVEITMDNWQEYFEIRAYEESYYNDFGDLTGHYEGHALYLKEEHLAKLAKASAQLPNGSVDVAFKVIVVREFREYDQENRKFVEGGKVYGSPTELEYVIDVYNESERENTDTYTSTGNGQVFAKMVCGDGAHAEGYYQGVYTEIDVIDVTGTLVFEE